MRITQAALELEARRFRTALEEYTRRNPDDRFTTGFLNPLRGEFPVDCCKSSSWMFAHHLLRTGWDVEVTYIWGWRGRASHGWLAVDGHIVDLTADQFQDEERTVIVAPIGTSPWHDTFTPHHSSPFEVSARHVSYARAIKVAELMPLAE